MWATTDIHPENTFFPTVPVTRLTDVAEDDAEGRFLPPAIPVMVKRTRNIETGAPVLKVEPPGFRADSAHVLQTRWVLEYGDSR